MSRNFSAARENLKSLFYVSSAFALRQTAFLLFGFLFVFAGNAFAQKDRAISEVQGEKNVSAFEKQSVRLTGIVTARIKSGFFLQTPDDKTDGNAATSEGIYVFTKSEPTGDAAIGNLISVTGTIVEFRRPKELSLSITELSHYKDRDAIKVISKANQLPKPVVLTTADFSKNQIDQLEKYEGMRVAIEALIVVAPTRGRIDDKTETIVSDGNFYAVVKGIPRPFREAGMDYYDIAFSSEKEKEKLKKDVPKIPIFDSNPETIRVDSSEQLGAPTMDVSAKTEIKNLVGVLHYGYQKYTILPDAGGSPTIVNQIKPVPLPAPNERQFSIASTNIETFVDDVDDPNIKEDIVSPDGFQKRLGKISRAVRDYLQTPDILAVNEAENLSVLKRLAEKINADALAAGKPNPKYEAYLMEGNDVRGIDSGFLVKASRVAVIGTKQLGKDEKYKNPVSGGEDLLNDRPSLLLEAAISDPKTNKPFAVTVIVSHLKSYLGIDDEKKAPNVRMKKRLQAEYLAKFVAERQKANPAERIVLVGDFNSFQFNDGILDVIGTITGKPAPKDAVLNPSEDFLNPDLTALVNLIKPDQQYSYLFDGNAQVLDHFLINDAMKKNLAGFGYARLNADFPQIYRGDASRVERYSDHDPAIAYFSFDEKPASNSNGKTNQNPK